MKVLRKICASILLLSGVCFVNDAIAMTVEGNKVWFEGGEEQLQNMTQFNYGGLGEFKSLVKAFFENKDFSDAIVNLQVNDIAWNFEHIKKYASNNGVILKIGNSALVFIFPEEMCEYRYVAYFRHSFFSLAEDISNLRNKKIINGRVFTIDDVRPNPYQSYTRLVPPMIYDSCKYKYDLKYFSVRRHWDSGIRHKVELSNNFVLEVPVIFAEYIDMDADECCPVDSEMGRKIYLGIFYAAMKAIPEMMKRLRDIMVGIRKTGTWNTCPGKAKDDPSYEKYKTHANLCFIGDFDNCEVDCVSCDTEAPAFGGNPYYDKDSNKTNPPWGPMSVSEFKMNGRSGIDQILDYNFRRDPRFFEELFAFFLKFTDQDDNKKMSPGLMVIGIKELPCFSELDSYLESFIVGDGGEIEEVEGEEEDL